MAVLEVWQLRLRDGETPRLDRPAVITLRHNLTIGRGDSHVLLDSAALPNLISRVHATFYLDVTEYNGPVVVHNHSINEVRLEDRSGDTFKATKNVAKDKMALLTEGCTVIFGRRGSLTEFCYTLHRLFNDVATQPDSAAAEEAAQAEEEEAAADEEVAAAEAAAMAAQQAAATPAEMDATMGEADEELRDQADAPMPGAANVEAAPAAAQAEEEQHEDEGEDEEDILIASLASGRSAGAGASGAASTEPEDAVRSASEAESAVWEPAVETPAPKEGETAAPQPELLPQEVEAPAAAAAPPAAAPDIAPPEPRRTPPSPSAMSLKDLRAELRARGVSYEGSVEKSDLVTLLRSARASGDVKSTPVPAVAPAAPAAANAPAAAPTAPPSPARTPAVFASSAPPAPAVRG